MTNDFPEALCLTELLDQDTSAYEFFQTLAPDIQTALRREDGGIGSLDQLQTRAAQLRAFRASFS